MAKIDLTSVLGGFRTQNQINHNFSLIERAFDNVLSRDGSLPNQMEADLDMNSNDILNVTNLTVDNLVIGAAAALPVLVSRSQETQNPGAGISNLTVNPYYVGNDSLTIYVDGLKQVIDVDYQEIGTAEDISTTVAMTSPFAGTETVDIVIDATYQKGSCANAAIVNWVSLADYICAGSDHDTAWTSALADACTYNKAVYIPAGEYDINVVGLLENCNMTILGDGPGKSTLRFHGCNGVSVQYSGVKIFRRFEIRDLSMIQDDATTGTAILLNNVGPTEGYHTIVSNIDFVDVDPATGTFKDHSWRHAVEISGVDDGTIEKCIFLSDITPGDPTSFITFNDSTTKRWNINGNSIGWCDRAFHFQTSATDWHELLNISYNKIADVDNVIWHEFTTGTDWAVLNLTLDNNTVKNCYKDGISMYGRFCDIHDNMLAHDPSIYGAAAGTYALVDLHAGSHQNRIHDNFIGCFPGSVPYNAYGVKLRGTDAGDPQEYNIVEDNTINYVNTGVYVSGDVVASRWQRNIYGAFVTTYINDTTADADRNYHGNGETTKYKLNTPTDITAAVSVGTAYQVSFDGYDSNKDDLDLDAVPTNIVNMPNYINRVRCTALLYVRSDAVPAPGTSILAQIVGTGVDGDPLPQFIAGAQLPAAANGDLVGLTLLSGTVEVVAGATLKVQVYSDAALAKTLFDAYFYIENIT